MYLEDSFKKPNPFEPSVVVPIDATIDKKLACVDALESQFAEWNPWLFGYLDEVPKDRAARLEWHKSRFGPRFASTAERFRGKLIEELGADRAKAVTYAEAFELCEYGSQPSDAELRRLFPFFGE
jgi:hypothetical protein